MHKLFAYPGGKWPIRSLIVRSFPNHKTYVDVFGGSAAILLTKDSSDGEVFNDTNEEIVNLFRVVKHRPAELAERARIWVHSRVLFEEMRQLPPPVDEIERAFRCWLLLADSFGAMGRNFGMTREGVHSVTKSRAHLADVADRLKNVHIECLDFAKCIKTYDSPDTFFYCDPPYRGTKGGNTNYNLLSDDEWKVLRETLGQAKGKFLLSSNNDPFVVRLFKGFKIREIDVRVTLPKNQKSGKRKEILVSNYVLPWGRSRHRRISYGPDRGMHHPSGPRMVKEEKHNYEVEPKK